MDINGADGTSLVKQSDSCAVSETVAKKVGFGSQLGAQMIDAVYRAGEAE